MFIILGRLENFSMDWRTGLVWDVPEIIDGFWEIFKHFKTLIKNFWEVSATFFIIWNGIFIFNQCDSLFRFGFIGKKVAQPFSKIFCLSFTSYCYLKVFKIRPFRFLMKANTNVSCFSCFSSFFLSKRFLVSFSS